MQTFAKLHLTRVIIIGVIIIENAETTVTLSPKMQQGYCTMLTDFAIARPK